MRHPIPLLLPILFNLFPGRATLLAQECIDYQPHMRWVASFAEPGLVMNDVAVSDGYAYVAAGFHSGPWNGLHVFDVSNPSQPKPAGTLNTPQQARDVAVGEGYAFLGVGGGLLIIDVSLPPAVVGLMDLPGGVSDVAATGHYAYIASGDSGLVIIDASSPAKPRIAGTYDTPGVAVAIALKGTLAYVADRESGLHVIDVTDPASPALVGTAKTPGTTYGIGVGEDLVAIADGGLTVIDVSDPRKPVVVGRATTPSHAGSVATDGRYAFLTQNTRPGSGGLHAFDLIDPASPIHIGTIEPPGIAKQVKLAGDLAYCVTGDSFEEGVHILDVSFATSPSPISSTAVPGASTVAIGGDLACVGSGGTGFAGGWFSTVDVSANPPAVLGSAQLWYPANDVAIAGNHAYVAEGAWVVPGGVAAALQIIDITSPGSPTPVGGVGLPHYGNAVAVDGSIAFVADQLSGLVVIDVSDPALPSITARLAVGPAVEVDIHGILAYVGTEGGLVIIDVSDPASPREIGRLQASAYSVAIEGNIACVAGHRSMSTVDIEDPENPVILGTLDLPYSFSVDIAVDQGYAYVTGAEFGMLVVDVSRLEAPRLVGQSRIEWGAYDIALDREMLYIAGPFGLSILPSQCRVPYAVDLSGLAAAASSEGILVRWQAAPELFTNFWIRRALGLDPLESSYTRLNPEQPIAGGGPWQYLDTSTIPGRTHAYKVDAERRDGGTETIGSVFATALVSASRPPALLALPNPAPGAVTLDIDLAQERELRLRVYDGNGRCVRVLKAGPMAQGRHAVRWDGRNDGGQLVANGHYLARLDWPGGSTTTRFVLLRD